MITNQSFRELIWQKGSELYRDMPWREDTKPYCVLVSELMLQQTQVMRVIPKFEEFIKRFPDETALAKASLGDVLKQWQGLGYNRRAKFLHKAAEQITAQDSFPSTFDELVKLPGIGKNTAGAILAYSLNQPSIFIETNVRTVYIHHFFNDHFDVDDRLIREKLEQTVDKEHPREFYWALMDYGAWLKAHGVRNVSRSRHYKKQVPLKGSIRETRGAIVKLLTAKEYDITSLSRAIDQEDRFHQALDGLVRDRLIGMTNGKVHLTK